MILGRLRKALTWTLVCRKARLFNGRILAAEAFKWDLEKMLHFLSEAAMNPSHYGVHRDHHHTLAVAVDKLQHLRLVLIRVLEDHMLKHS